MVLGCDWVSIVSSEPSSSDLFYKQKTKDHIHSILFHQLNKIFTDKHNFPNHQSQKMLPINQSFDKIWEKFEKNLRHQSYISMKKHQLTLQNARQWPAHMTHTTGTTGTTVVVLLSYYTVQLQAWCIHCPISAQIRLVIISHIPYFWYSCD